MENANRSSRVLRVVVAGSRGFNDYDELKFKLDYFLREKVKWYQIIIVSGTANGADKLGERYAQENKYICEKYPAKWDSCAGRSAGFVRNAEMADAADVAVLFWDGCSKGTAHMKEQMQSRHKPVRIVYFEKKVKTKGCKDELSP